MSAACASLGLMEPSILMRLPFSSVLGLRSLEEASPSIGPPTPLPSPSFLTVGMYSFC
jgi:hypothetical protein